MQPTIPQPVFLNVEYLFSQGYVYLKNILAWLFSLRSIETLKAIAAVLLILAITVVLYTLVRLYELKKETEKKNKPTPPPQSVPVGPSTTSNPSVASLDVQTIHNPVWEGIRMKLLSDNQSDWRLGIIEADIYLDRLLDDAGYHGETVSDKLKQVNAESIASIQLAWEAHKVRNRIAHDMAFTLTQPEVRRVLSYYEIVFRDMGAIS